MTVEVPPREVLRGLRFFVGVVSVVQPRPVPPLRAPGARPSRISPAIDEPPNLEEALAKVRQALSGLRFGEVIVKVQDGRVVWVDRFERERVG